MQQANVIYRSYPHEVKSVKQLSPLQKKFYGIIRLFGASLTSFAMASFIISYTPAFNADFSSKFLKKNNIKAPVTESVSKVVLTTGSNVQPVAAKSFDESTSVFKEAKKWGVDTKFSIVVPQIDAKSKVIANVDPFNPEIYKDALMRGVAHASGTYYPGQGGTVYLFAHSTDTSVNVARYNAIFYQLRNLQYDDRILIFYDLGMYEYRVTERHTVAADDTSWLEPKHDKERIILQTCDPPGTTWKRLLIIAERV